MRFFVLVGAFLLAIVSVGVVFYFRSPMLLDIAGVVVAFLVALVDLIGKVGEDRKGKKARENQDHKLDGRSSFLFNFSLLLLILQLIFNIFRVCCFPPPPSSPSLPKGTLWIDPRHLGEPPLASGFVYLRTEKYDGDHPLHIYRHQKTGLEFVLVPGGQFYMGSPLTEKGRFPEEGPQRWVSVPPFLMSRTEVTQEVWKRVMGTAPWQGQPNVREGRDYPAVYVTWQEAMEFCNRTGLGLPSEAQWEYACRGGRDTPFFWGETEKEIDHYAWYAGNAWEKGEKYAHPVGKKLPNPFGLLDIVGNVYEWCLDRFHSSYKGLPTDGSAHMGCDLCPSFRVVRSSSYRTAAQGCRSAARMWANPEARALQLGDIVIGIGFRVVAPIPELTKKVTHKGTK